MNYGPYAQSGIYIEGGEELPALNKKNELEL